MATTFRPSTPADAPAIAALLEEVGLHPSKQPEYLHWKYWQEREDWTGPRSFVLAQKDTIIAHAGIVPGWVRCGSDRYQVFQTVDWAARDGAVGAGVSLMKRIGRLADGLLSIGGRAQTRQILPHLGCRPYASATGFVRTLRPLGIWRHSRRSWRVPARMIRSAIWHLSAPSGGIESWNCRRVDADGLEPLAPVLPAPARDMAVLERNLGLLRHALGCPIVPTELYMLSQGGRPRGYFLLSAAPGQMRLADCWVDSDQPAEWHALIRCAVQQAKRAADIAELVVWSSDPLLSRCLRECGFRPRNNRPVLLRLPDGQSLPTATLRVQMLDTDEAYVDALHPNLWA